MVNRVLNQTMSMPTDRRMDEETSHKTHDILQRYILSSYKDHDTCIASMLALKNEIDNKHVEAFYGNDPDIPYAVSARESARMYIQNLSRNVADLKALCYKAGSLKKPRYGLETTTFPSGRQTEAYEWLEEQDDGTLKAVKGGVKGGGRSDKKNHWTKVPNRKAKVHGTMRALYSNPEHPGELRVLRMLRDPGGTRRAAYVRISGCKPPPKKK